MLIDAGNSCAFCCTVQSVSIGEFSEQQLHLLHKIKNKEKNYFKFTKQGHTYALQIAN